MRYFFLLMGCMCLLSATAQDLSSLNDEFDQTGLNGWTFLHDVEKWPNKLAVSQVNKGQLVLEPRSSGWFNDANAPFIYKTVTGDFDVQARVRSGGLQGGLSNSPWSLGGLMVRVPRSETADNWSMGRENWLFMTTGIAEKTGEQVVESKYTLNSRSNLKLRPAKAEWITLRIVRVGPVFVLMYRYDGDNTWTIQDRFYVQQWPHRLQVGLNCYTTSSRDLKPKPDELTYNKTLVDDQGTLDMRLAVDYVRFKRPAISFNGQSPYENWYNSVAKNNLADYSLSNEELIKLLQ